MHCNPCCEVATPVTLPTDSGRIACYRFPFSFVGLFSIPVLPSQDRQSSRWKERHLAHHADGFNRPDPLRSNERRTITDSVERYLKRVEVSQDPQTTQSLQAITAPIRTVDRLSPTGMRSTEITYWHFGSMLSPTATPDSPLIGSCLRLQIGSKPRTAATAETMGFSRAFRRACDWQQRCRLR